MGLLYTKMKIFHFHEKIESLPEQSDLIKAPVQIRIKPTNVCSHNCSYCAYRAENLQLGKDMLKSDLIPQSKMIEIIDDCEEIGVKSITFSGGGDPFHYPYLSDAVKRLSKTKIKFASLTHGAKLEGELAEQFAYNATWIRISIDGWDDESYAHYRSVKIGEFSKVLNNIEKFAKLGGKCYLGVVLVVDQFNASHVYEQIKRFSGIGVNSVKISPCIVSNSGSENNAYHSSIFKLVKAQIKKATAEFANRDLEIFDSYHILDEKFTKYYHWCPYLQIVPVIGADLNVYSCHDKAYNMESGMLGSIKDMRLKDFWLHDKGKFFKIDPSIHCNHHCVMNTNNKLIIEYLDADRDHLEFV
ncbi:MAG: radical SAM protein [Dissulfurispiraceae bacterium]|jgi:MoaA/NifB/PqqE/SkfB family radical SAM enzyme|nr:radical SAM protein [Dissulfurispiraceae bacterium]